MAKKLLVVVDMQNDFIDGSLGSKDAEAIVQNVVAKINGWDGAVISTLDTHGENYLETLEGQKLPVAHCIKETAGWRLNPAIAEAVNSKGAKIVEKGTFGCVKLGEIIREWIGMPEEIHVCGLCTDICVVSNALLLRAEFPNIRMAVCKDCCAGVTPAKHAAALDVMASCQIDVL